MATLNNLFPSNYLKADDLDGERIVTIERVEMELVGKDKESKAVAYFEGEPKGLILNKTNAVAISAISGSQDTDDWPGAQMVLVIAAVDFRGTLTNAIRIKPLPKQRRAPNAAATEPAINRDEAEAF